MIIPTAVLWNSLWKTSICKEKYKNIENADLWATFVKPDVQLKDNLPWALSLENTLVSKGLSAKPWC